MHFIICACKMYYNLSHTVCLSTEKQLKGESVSQCDWHFTNLFLSSKSGSGSPSSGLIEKVRDNSPKSRPYHSTSGATSERSGSELTASFISVGGGGAFSRGGGDGQATSHSTPSSPIPSAHLPPAHRYTPPSTPPTSRHKAVNAGKYPSTPPPKQKLLLFPDAQPIQKSKSHESQLANRVVDIDPIK
jgi:hypothetical protein